MVLRTCLLLTAGALALGGCDCGGDPSPDASRPPRADSGPRSPEACGNGVDDDGDGLVDCDDPECGAPPLDPDGPSSFFDSVRFLVDPSAAACVGGAARQTGADDLVPSEAAVVTGFVEDADGFGLGGVEVRVVGRPGHGVTRTAADGRFFMVVNAGPAVVLELRAAGWLPSQRTLVVPRHQFTWAGRVVLVARSAQVTQIALGGDAPQLARGAEVRDADGVRAAAVFVPPRTEASLVMPDGGRVRAERLHLRLTEFTTTDRGLDRMPGTLPDASGYTYAIEVDTDEGVEAGARSVEFDRPVPLYVDNFLGFPVGTPVPHGSYDRAEGRWVAERDGRVIRVVGERGGLAEIDADGDGAADSDAALRDLGVTEDERRTLAGSYAVGAEIWRAPIEHLTPWDCNWPFGPPLGFLTPDFGLPTEDGSPQPCQAGGSVVGCQQQTLGEALPVAGTGQALHYQSALVPGRGAAYRVEVPLGRPGLPADVLGVDIEIDVAGVHVEAEEAVDDTRRFRWDWDGRDAFGRLVPGISVARVRVGYRYAGEYREPGAGGASFGAPGGAFITGNRTREEVTVWREHTLPLGVEDRRRDGLGGWSLSAHHRFDPRSKVLTRGDGRRVDYSGRVPPVERFAGSVTRTGVSGDGGPARDALLAQTSSLAVASDGRVFIADSLAHRIRVVLPDGTIDTYAGTGRAGSSGDGGPASVADIARPASIAIGPDDSLYVASLSEGCIRRVDPGGFISTFAGQCGVVSAGGGNGGPATAGTLGLVGPVAVDDFGRVCFAESLEGLIRCVEPGTGILTQLAGGGAQPPESARARDAFVSGVTGLAFDTDGRLYAAIPGRHRVYVIAGGFITTYAGTGAEAAFEFEGGALSRSMVAPFALAMDPCGDLCITDLGPGQLICVDRAGIARLRVSGPGSLRDGAPANQVSLIQPNSVAFGPDGDTFIGQGADFGAFVTRIEPSWPRAVGGEWWVPSEDAGRLYRFSATGRHLATHSVQTQRALLTFGYDSEGRLSEVEDEDGHRLGVERGATVDLVGPFGQRTALTIGADGWLRELRDPASRRWALDYHPEDARGRGGLLRTYRAPGGSASTFTYDDAGRLVRDEGDEGFELRLARTADGLAEEIVRTTAEGRQTRYRDETDAAGGPRTVVTQPDGTTITVTRPEAEDAGDVAFVSSDGTALSVGSTPHPLFGRAAPFAATTTLTLPSGASLTTSRRAEMDFEPLTVPPVIREATWVATTPRGETTSRWSAATRTLTVTSPESRVAAYELDEGGRLVWIRAPGLHPVQYVYDAEGRVAEVRRGVGAASRRVAFDYAPDGPLRQVTPPDDVQVAFGTDALGRVTRVDGRGPATGFAYDDDAGRLTVTQPGGGDHVLNFDLRGRIDAYAAPGATPIAWSYDADGASAGVSVGAAHEVAFELDATTGRPTRITAGGDAIVPTYEPTSGFVRAIAGPGGVTVGFERDGPRTEEQSWSGAVTGRVRYGYDAAFQLDSVRVGSESPVALSFDRDGLLTAAGPVRLTRDPASGFATAVAVGATAAAQRFDGFGALDELTTTWPGGGRFGQVVLRRDALGRVREVEESDGVALTRVEYVYDGAARLHRVLRDGVEAERYEYGPNGQRTRWTNAAGTFSPTFDAQGRLARVGATTYEHDDYGQRLAVVSGPARTSTTYDDFGNLREVSLPSGATVRYEVDAYGRRVAKDVDGVRERAWLYLDALRPVAELAADGSVRAIFVYGSRRNVPDAIRTPTATYRVVIDRLGSVRRVVDATSGAVVQAIDYDAFGRVLRDTNPGFQPFGFAGGLYDPDTGLVRFGARDYDPDVGQWTARDPIGLAGGDTNLYAYVGNDPVNAIDPTGLYVESAIDVASIGYDLYALARDNVFGNCDNLGSNLLALGLDVVGLALPFVGGLGMASRGAGAAGRLVALDANAFRHLRTIRRGVVSPADTLFVSPNVAVELGRHGISRADIAAAGVRISSSSPIGAAVAATRVADVLRSTPTRGAASAAPDALNLVEATGLGADVFLTADRQVLRFFGGRSRIPGTGGTISVLGF
ncbi:MAG: RHS repeat-associated core domain-containing protein [Sandaracinaceae bacterium]